MMARILPLGGGLAILYFQRVLLGTAAWGLGTGSRFCRLPVRLLRHTAISATPFPSPRGGEFYVFRTYNARDDQTTGSDTASFTLSLWS